MRALGLMLFMGVVIVGCGPDIRAQCEAEVQCKSGNDKDIEACVAVKDELQDFLADIGCDDEYEALFECTEPLQQCNSVPTGDTCMTDEDCSADDDCSGGECVRRSYSIEAEDQDKCEAETAAYNSCTDLF